MKTGPQVALILFVLASMRCSRTAAAEGGVPVTGSSTKVEQLLRKNLAARGGEAAWSRVNTLMFKGEMDAGQGMQVPYVMDLKRGRKVRVEIIFQGQTAIQTYDGKTGWKLRPFLGRHEAEPFTPDESMKAGWNADLDGLLIGYEARGTHIDLEGEDKVEGHKAYKLKLTTKDGQIRHVWLDAETYLEIKLEGMRRLDGKMKTADTFLRDYRTVDGVKIPFVYETATDGVKNTGTIHVENVEVNPPLEDALFQKPR